MVTTAPGSTGLEICDRIFKCGEWVARPKFHGAAANFDLVRGIWPRLRRRGFFRDRAVVTDKKHDLAFRNFDNLY